MRKLEVHLIVRYDPHKEANLTITGIANVGEDPKEIASLRTTFAALWSVSPSNVEGTYAVVEETRDLLKYADLPRL